MQAPNYSLLDRMVHKLAFGFGQRVMCDLEAQIFGDEISDQSVDRPVFVTALPRAGTTLLLEVLSRHPDVVTHTYRDMPFVLSPALWARLSAKFQVDLQNRERSHSDGLMVNADSPEAFEEVLWLRQTPDAFAETHLETLAEDRAVDIRAPLSDLIRRLVASRRQDGSRATRYVSKNNANIARIPALREAFPDAQVLVPLRMPIDHAISLHRQHRRYREIHAESIFARDYMKDIGHFEFGALHRPILFGDMDQAMEAHDPESLDYWVAYWICAIEHLRGQAGITFVDMERFTANCDLDPILDSVDLEHDDATRDAARNLVRPIRRYDASAHVDVSPGLLKRALSLYEDIRPASVTRTQ